MLFVAIAETNPVKKLSLKIEGEGRRRDTRGKETQRNKGLYGQIGLGPHLPEMWLSILHLLVLRDPNVEERLHPIISGNSTFVC